MSISQNFPSTRPSLNLNFARSKTLDPRITFTRTSTGTYVDENGLIKTAPANSPRFDHDPVTGECLGLLIEEQRENLLPYSIVSSLTWSNTDTVTNNVTISPDGTNTAARIQVGAGYVALLNVSVTSGEAYTFSFWLKSVSGSGTWGINIFDHGIPSHNRTTVNITEEWQRVSYTYTPTGTTINVYVSDDRDNLATINDGYVWGAQLEKGSFMTSLIPTSGSTATRSPDSVTMTGENFSDWYNQDEGTIYVSQKLKSIDTVDRNSVVYLINGGSGSDLFYNVKKGDRNIFVFGDGGTNYSRWQEDGDATDTKTIWAYDVSGDDFKPYWNGIEGVNESTTNTPSATSYTQLEIGATISAKYNGHISQLTYYPVRLPNETLQTLTK